MSQLPARYNFSTLVRLIDDNLRMQDREKRRESALPFYVYILITALTGICVAALVNVGLHRRRKLGQPRITLAELEAFRARLAAASLPMVRVKLIPDAPLSAKSSKIGGHPFADSPRRKWPVRGDDRVPMLFFGQINFAEIPQLEDFPSHGLLQLFVSAEKSGAMDETTRKSDRVIRWFPQPEGNLTLTPPNSLTVPHKRATFSQRVIRYGMGMQFEPGEGPASRFNWPYEESFPNTFRRLPENEEVGRRLAELEKELSASENTYVDHWIGGHPKFVQFDVRQELRLRKLNRVLLHVSADNVDIHMVDSGELNLMISRKALRNTKFDEAYCYWDFS